MHSAPTHQPLAGGPAAGTRLSESQLVDLSCRWPVLIFFGCAVAWLVSGSVLGLIASVKLHAPALLADCPWLTYGRITPAATQMYLYGFACQSAFGVILWLIARLGRVPLLQPFSLTLAAVLWNVGLLVGVIGILAGDFTGYDAVSMPRYAAPILFAGYLLVGISALVTLHFRVERTLYVSQWFIFVALFWFPWIFAAAHYLLLWHPVRGVVQTVVDYWYGGNLITMWLTPIGLATIFYFVPKLLNRPLYSKYLAGITFWPLLFFGGFIGIPASAPLPSWISSVSIIAEFFLVVPIAAAAWNLRETARGQTRPATVVWRCMMWATGALVIGFGLALVFSLRSVAQYLQLTVFATAVAQVTVYGFFAFAMFGAIYYIVPRLTNLAWPSPNLAQLHLFCSTSGLVLFVGATAAAGGIEAVGFAYRDDPFPTLWKAMMPWIGLSTLGLLALLIGHVALAVNFFRMMRSCCATCCGPVIRQVRESGARL